MSRVRPPSFTPNFEELDAFPLDPDFLLARGLHGVGRRAEHQRDRLTLVVLVHVDVTKRRLDVGVPHPGSVVDAWVAFERFSPWKFTVGLPGSSGGSRSSGFSSLRRKLLS